MLVLVFILSVTSFVYASEPLSSASSQINSDHFTKLNDYGISDIINNVEDKEVRDKLIEFWYTPAYTTNSLDSASPQAQRAEMKDSAIETITELAEMSGAELDNAINEIKEERMQEIVNSDAVPTEALIEDAREMDSPLLNQLESKIESEDRSQETFDENVLESSLAAASTIKTSSVAGSTYNYNTSGQVMYYMRITVTWKYDSSTSKVTSVSESTDYGADMVYFFVGVHKSEKGLSSSKSYGYVHKQ